MEGRAEVISMGVQIGVGRPHPQGEVERSEVQGAVKRLRIGNALGIDSITKDMLKWGGHAVLKWLFWICE